MRSPVTALLVAFAAALSALAFAADAAGVEVPICEGREATWVGTDAADTFVDTVGTDDVIVALGGDDVIETGAGDDIVCAGAGDDVVRTGWGHDSVWGQNGDDAIFGEGNDDRLRGGPGDDVIEGGAGSDQISGDEGHDELWGSSCSPSGGLDHFCRETAAALPVVDDSVVGAALFAATRVLRAGVIGDDVAGLQEVLGSLGLDAGPIDGVFGSLTTAAVRAFQSERGLAVDGAVGTQTRDALAAAVGGVEVSAPPPPAPDPLGTRTLRWGDRGDDVAAVQQALSRRGFDPGPADGVFGGMTATAVRAFQAARGLGVDGVVGMQTRVALSGDTGAGDVLEGGVGFDTCNDPDGGAGCESVRGIRSGAPWSAAAAAEWRPLVAEVFSAWDLEEEVERAVAVVACESLGDPFVTTPSRNGSEVIGLFQHSSTYWDDRAADAGIPGGSPLAPRDNVTVAAWLVRRSIDLGDANGPWHHFDCGRLLGFWPDGA